MTTKKENVTTRNLDTPDPFDVAVSEAMAELAAQEEPENSTSGTDELLVDDSIIETEAPAADDQAPDDVEEQVEEVLDPQVGEDDEDSDELLAGLELDPEEEVVETPDPASDLHTLPGIDEPVTTEELRNGYLRQADYTRKTQEVAAERERLEKAEQFYDALVNHPKELARQLAVAAGYIEADAQPINVVELPFRADEDVQAEIDQKVEEALANHPDIEEARNLLALQWVDSQFAELEAEFGKPIGEKSRNLILNEFQKTGGNDLKLVARALVLKAQDQARKREALKGAAPAKPAGRASQQAVTAEPSNFEEAAADAAASLGIELDLSKLG